MENTKTIKSSTLANVEIRIEGTTPILFNRYMETGSEPSSKQENPKEICDKKLYYMDNGEIGVPTIMFLRSGYEASKGKNWFSGKRISGKAFLGSVYLNSNMVKLNGKRIDRDDVGLQRGVPKHLYRPSFVDWSVVLPVTINVNILKVDEVIQILAVAGIAVGVGAWRQQCGGSFGKYKPVDVREVG